MRIGNKSIFWIASIIAVSILSASHAQSEQIKVNPDTAKQIVSDYKSLRSYCSRTQEQARRDCFSKLSATTEEYKVAKFILTRQEPQTNTIANAQANW